MSTDTIAGEEASEPPAPLAVCPDPTDGETEPVTWLVTLICGHPASVTDPVVPPLVACRHCKEPKPVMLALRAAAWRGGTA